MEGNAVSLPHHSDISTHPQPGNVEKDSATSDQPSQRHAKPIERSDQWMKIREENSMLKRENARLIQDREDLIVDLEKCKLELFKRMPPTQISDESIQKAVGRIHGSIDGFVFDIMGDVVADDALFILCQRKQQKQKKQKRRKSHNPLTNFIRQEDISLWGPYDCSNFYILSVIIQWILDEFVFRDRYPMGITEKHRRVLEDVEKSMRYASKPLKQERYDIWRSETLTALTALRENENRLEEASKRICKRLSDILSPWLIGSFASIEGRFRLEILDPAIRLHQSLRSSRHQYDTGHTPDFDKVSPQRMLDHWQLKDADTWQKPRDEKAVGKALYCLHPSVVRLGTEGTNAVVVAKPVIIVANPERERMSNPRSLKDSSLSGMTAPPAAFESNPEMNLIISSRDQEISVQVDFVDRSSTLTDSDSTTDSEGRRLSSHKRRASTHPTIKQQDSLSESFQRRQTVPLVLSRSNEDRPAYSKFPLEVERQSSGRPKEDHDVPKYRRGHYIEGSWGSAYTHQSQGALRNPSRRASRDRSDGRSSPRRVVNDSAQPSIALSTSVPSTASTKSRSVIGNMFNWL